VTSLSYSRFPASFRPSVSCKFPVAATLRPYCWIRSSCHLRDTPSYAPLPRRLTPSARYTLRNTSITSSTSCGLPPASATPISRRRASNRALPILHLTPNSYPHLHEPQCVRHRTSHTFRTRSQFALTQSRPPQRCFWRTSVVLLEEAQAAGPHFHRCVHVHCPMHARVDAGLRCRDRRRDMDGILSGCSALRCQIYSNERRERSRYTYGVETRWPSILSLPFHFFLFELGGHVHTGDQHPMRAPGVTEYDCSQPSIYHLWDQKLFRPTDRQ